jgi:uncharacterized protein YjeT (DUF2065 family)
MWQDLAAALGLMLVIEGILPFANPRGFRDALRLMAEVDDAALRVVGLVSMLAGLLLVYWVR